jgi:hypothetical protein
MASAHRRGPHVWYFLPQDTLEEKSEITNKIDREIIQISGSSNVRVETTPSGDARDFPSGEFP